MDIVLVHGYNVTSTRTYGVLPQRLKAAGHKIKDVYLSKYVTLDNDITMRDIVRGFQAALEDVYGKNFANKEFACITHSTGGIVVRSWISTYYASAMAKLPITHLIMLAPPTNGSRLATIGKSRLSRLRSLIGVEPGLKILDALELGSEFQWDLNCEWMDKKLYAAKDFYPVVITGQWIDKKLWDAIVPATYERGSDGVVRASAANLNMQKMIISPDGTSQKRVMGGIPFLIPPKVSHSDDTYGIMGSIPEKGDNAVLNAILMTLDVKTRQEYNELEADFAMKTTLLQRNDQYYDGTPLERYCQLVFRVVDSQGNPLEDYAIELLDNTMWGGQLPGGSFGDQHKNDVKPEKFTFYLNYDRISQLKGGRLGFRLQCASGSDLVNYPDLVFLGKTEAENLIKPNQTTFIDVVLKRRLNKEAFRLTKSFEYQKITGKPGDEWIE